MNTLISGHPFRNPVSVAARLPDSASLLMAARAIERKYSVTPGMARVVAELVSTSITEARR
jgi:hypothetical protein